MRISDWSSDVCSSDLRKKTIGCRTALDQSLVLAGSEHIVGTAQHTGCRAASMYMIATHRRQSIHGVEGRAFISPHLGHIQFPGDVLDQIGRTSCKERACLYV